MKLMKIISLKVDQDVSLSHVSVIYGSTLINRNRLHE